MKLNIVYNVNQEMRPVGSKARSFKLDAGEVHMEMVVWGLVVDVHVEFAGWYSIFIWDGFLKNVKEMQ